MACRRFSFFLLNSRWGFAWFQVLPEPASPTPMETSGCAPADLCQAFSDVMLHAAVRDVDADDYDNPMLCSEYVKDIYKYLRQLEASETNPLPQTQTSVTVKIELTVSCSLRSSRT